MKTVFLIGVFLVHSFNPAVAQTQQSVLDELDEYLVRTSTYMGNCPYAVVVSKDGQIIHERYHDGGGIVGEVDSTTKWQLFSITKGFVSALLLDLVDDGVIKLDDPVSKYLLAFESSGEGAFDRRNVTIRHLASHTHGAALDTAGFPSDLRDIRIETEPGKGFLYSALSTHILELAIQSATGQDFDDLITERVLEPLGLQSTGYIYGEDDPNGPVLPLRPETYYFSQPGQRAGSGIFSTARDLNRFGGFWIDPTQLFKKELLKDIWTQHGTRDLDGASYGLLWWLLADHGGYVMSGYGQKVNAVIPEKGVVVTVIRYTQNNRYFEFSADKHAFVSFGNRL
jgi:CubicO group peptidase (beta-lactamase class C family)